MQSATMYSEGRGYVESTNSVNNVTVLMKLKPLLTSLYKEKLSYIY